MQRKLRRAGHSGLEVGVSACSPSYRGGVGARDSERRFAGAERSFIGLLSSLWRYLLYYRERPQLALPERLANARKAANVASYVMQSMVSGML